MFSATETDFLVGRGKLYRSRGNISRVIEDFDLPSNVGILSSDVTPQLTPHGG